MDEKYVDKYKETLKNRLYRLLCEREKEGSWETFLDNILITFLISSSRPMTGSSFWSLAAATRSLPYFSRDSYVSSGESEVTL